MDPHPPPDLTQPSEERARTILSPDPSVGTGYILPGSQANISPADAKAQRDVLATIQGFNFNAEYTTPSEEQ